MNKIKTKIFNNLISTAECQTGSDTETIGFKCKYGSYEISFFSEDGVLIIDDFGYTSKNNWVICEPTEEQNDIMQSKIDNRYSELCENINDYMKFEKDCHNYREVGF